MSGNISGRPTRAIEIGSLGSDGFWERDYGGGFPSRSRRRSPVRGLGR